MTQTDKPTGNVPTSATALANHPLRATLTREMHTRMLPVFSAPSRLAQIVLISSPDTLDAHRQAARDLCKAMSADDLPGDDSHFMVDLGPVKFCWEAHTEVCTYTFLQSGRIGGDPFDNDILSHLPSGWLSNLPGEAIRGTRIEVLSADDQAPDPAMLDGLFSDDDLVGCTVVEGGAQVWSDFRLHEDGFGRLLLRNVSLAPRELVRTVQRLQELGNYRKLALMGYPQAREGMAILNTLDARLDAITRDIASADNSADERELLKNLSRISAELMNLASTHSYRMDATQAYANLVQDRLRQLGSERIPGFPTLVDFNDRRLTPAVRTCLAFRQRVEGLSTRAANVSALLRTRVDTTMASQSRDLLESMNQRARMQLRMQQTVEGLSVIAITYYAVGLASYVLKPLAKKYTVIDPLWVTAGSVIVIGGLVWFLVSRVRKHLIKVDEPSKSDA